MAHHLEALLVTQLRDHFVRGNFIFGRLLHITHSVRIWRRDSQILTSVKQNGALYERGCSGTRKLPSLSFPPVPRQV